MQRRLLTLSLAAGLAACGPPPLQNAHDTADALARAIVDAIAKRDEKALRAIALDESEFRAHVWRDLPAARPERNLPFSFVWGDLRQKSDLFLRGTLAEHGGKRYVLVRLTFAQNPSNYPGFHVHRDPIFEVRDGAGRAHALRLSGSFLEKDGRWKVFSYVADD